MSYKHINYHIVDSTPHEQRAQIATWTQDPLNQSEFVTIGQGETIKYTVAIHEVEGYENGCEQRLIALFGPWLEPYTQE